MATTSTDPSHQLPIDEARERLRVLIRDLAVVRGRVTLSSGAEADHYVDLRRITLHHEAAPLVGRVMLDLQRRIEGPDVTGRRVVAVEDTSTTGGSVLTACEALTEAGAEIAAVAVIVHRSDASREAVEQAGHRYLAAYDISELEI
jgi:orotate phosphoribosyltransferase